MMDQVLVFFLISLVIGVFWFRILFLFLPQKYKGGSFIRSRTGLRWHHWHHGVVFLIIGIALTLFQGKTVFSFTVLGLGLGLIVDEFFMTLRLETPREEELKVYDKSFSETLLLTLGILAVLLLISFLF